MESIGQAGKEFYPGPGAGQGRARESPVERPIALSYLADIHPKQIRSVTGSA
jgi:hypothetical protein